jgi:hypothetical protein
MLKLDGFLVAGKKAQDIEPSKTFVGFSAWRIDSSYSKQSNTK